MTLLVKPDQAGSVIAEAIIRVKAHKRHTESPEEEQDIVTWAHRYFRIPETKEPVELLPHQQAVLRFVFTKDEESGRFPFTTFIYSTPKKSGKTAIAGLVSRWFSERQCTFGEVYCIGNDGEQAKERGFRAAKRSIMLTPRFVMEGVGGELPGQWRATDRHLRHLPSGTVIKAIPVDAPGEAGANPDLTVWTELWGMEHASALHFWEEMTPVPTRLNSIRMVETYAGYDGESDLLRGLYDLAKEGRQVTAGELSEATGMPLGVFEEATKPDDLVPIWVNDVARLCMYWDEGEIAHRMPWQRGKLGEEYYREESNVLPARAFERIHLNRWVGAESEFVPIGLWDACYDQKLPPLVVDGIYDKTTPLVLGLDAAATGDCFAAVAVSRCPSDPTEAAIRGSSKWDPKDFGGRIDYAQVIAWLEDILSHHNVVQIAYDPHQLEQMMQDFRARELAWCEPFPQQRPRLVADRQLYDLIIKRKLHHHGDPAIREHVLNAKAKFESEQDSKLRIIKKAANRKIDLVVATSMAVNRCLYLTL